jgi:HD-like signal output (HDOD) protein
MPGVDGLALLTVVRDRFPNAARIMLSGHAEVEAALRSIPIAHQFLSKPCDAALIKQVIDRACQLEGLVRGEAVRRNVGGLGALPSSPRIYNELNAALANPGTSMAEIARIVEQDVGISARILQIVNSGFFGMPRRVTTVNAAVGYLGAGMIKSLALSAGVFDAFDVERQLAGFSIDAEQRHAFLTASIAAKLFTDRQLSGEAFTAGMLHDVGTLILASRLPSDLARVRSAERRPDEPEHEVETRLLGFSHAEIGAYLLGLWGLPFPIVEAVGFHHAPDQLGHARFDIVAAAHIADALARELAPDPDRSPPQLDAAYLARIGAAEKIDAWRAEATRLAGSCTEAPVGP